MRWQFLELFMFLFLFSASPLNLMIKTIVDLQSDELNFNPKVQSKWMASIQIVIEGVERTMH